MPSGPSGSTSGHPRPGPDLRGHATATAGSTAARSSPTTSQRLTSVELGLGGAWLLCPPQLLFVPDRDGDDVPDGAGRGRARRLLGRRRRTTTPSPTACDGAPTAGSTAAAGPRRRARSASPARPTPRACPIRGGLWRFHPTRKRFEMLAHGTTNPWGHDWNALGEAFFINTVNGHLWHLIPGLPPRPAAHDRPQPAGLRPDRPARRPLALGQRQGLDLRQQGRRRATTAAAAATPTAG